MKDTRLIEVCDECGMACCVQGVFMCDKARGANVRKVPAYKLMEQERKIEHPDYWSKETMGNVYGDEAPFGYEED